MNSENQEKQIGKSLKVVTEIFSSCSADYRVLGSTLLVAHINKVFRHINDVDVLLDIRARDCVFEKLKNYGFELEQKTKYPYSVATSIWLIMVHWQHLAQINMPSEGKRVRLF